MRYSSLYCILLLCVSWCLSTFGWLQRASSLYHWKNKQKNIVLKSSFGDAIVDNERFITEKQVTAFRGETIAQVESVYRKYPFHNASLPELPDANNYYSGAYNDLLWHQNGDQVYVFIPMFDHSISTRDIFVRFSVSKIEIQVNGKVEFAFSLLDKIIPDGSSWTWETDKTSGQRYLHLDMEKRYRIINWKSLFLLSEEELKAQKEKAKSDLFKQFVSANKGLSKLTGAPPVTSEEMLKDLDFMEAISEVPEKEKAYLKTGDSDEMDIELGELDEPIIPFESFQEIVDAKKRQEEEKNE